MERNEDLIVGGYQFATVADAETARQDAKRVKNLEDNLDYKKPQNVLAIYNKALENKVLMTPIGFAYLLQMQEHLKHCGIPENKINPIPLNVTFSNKTEANRSIRESIAARKPKVEFKGRFITSVCFNILLIFVIVAMFLISFKSDVPNIINYRRAILDEYSEWEQELTEREKTVREAEKSMGITP